MNKQFKLAELREYLKLSTFNAESYIGDLSRGCYIIDSEVYFGIITHPAVITYYQRRVVYQQRGENLNVIDPAKYFTIFKSVSEHHLEFNNGVVFVRNLQ